MYIKLPEMYPYDPEDLRKEYPNISFPADLYLRKNILNEYNIFEVIPTDKPLYNSNTHKLVELFPDLVEGIWQQVWGVELISEEEQQYKLDNLSAEARALRNRLLIESDWTQFKDTNPQISELWAPYRQSLRDITSQPGFPVEILWPTKPV